MPKEELIVTTGVVTDALPSTLFKVKIESLSCSILCRNKGKIQQKRIRIIPGDLVSVEISPYDLTKGRIISRLSGKAKPNATNNSKK